MSCREQVGVTCASAVAVATGKVVELAEIVLVLRKQMDLPHRRLRLVVVWLLMVFRRRRIYGCFTSSVSIVSLFLKIIYFLITFNMGFRV